MSDAAVEFRICAGPSTDAPFTAVVAEFVPLFNTPLPASDVERRLAHVTPENLTLDVALPQAVSFTELVGLLGNALQNLAGDCGLPMTVATLPDGRCRIALGYRDAEATKQALLASVRIASETFALAHGGPDHSNGLRELVRRTHLVMQMRQPDYIARALMRIAQQRSIPVYPVSPGSRVWQFGQGSAGLHFWEAANEDDSLTGARITQDKFLSNQLITRLGLPGVKHRIVPDLHAANRVARELGYPVVVKPVDRGKGRGVTANIANATQLAGAFSAAIEHSPRGVLVEKHVAGDDHRMAVFGGQFRWAARRSPPRVMGNGTYTVAELIERENQNRSDADVAAGFTSRLIIDEDLLMTLSKQGIRISDRPAPGAVVQLRMIANVATGGTIRDCTDAIHADNRAMAEAIARGLRMDAIGIDFMTPDITKSWRDVDCAVLEVNRTPGFGSDERAETILAAKFPAGTDGRLPVLVAIGAHDALFDELVTTVAVSGAKVGSTRVGATRVDGEPRRVPNDDLAARVAALVLDAVCDVLVIGVSIDELDRQGFPLDRCDLAVIFDRMQVTDAQQRLINRCAARVLAHEGSAVDGELAAEIDALRARGSLSSA